jgi:hypothetical protein
MVSGYLEHAEVPITHSRPGLHAYALPQDTPEMSDVSKRSFTPRRFLEDVVLRAIIISDAHDLDLPSWDAAIDARERAGLGI